MEGVGNGEKETAVSRGSCRLLRTLSRAHGVARTTSGLCVARSTLSGHVGTLRRRLKIRVILHSQRNVHFAPTNRRILLRDTTTTHRVRGVHHRLTSVRNRTYNALQTNVSIGFSCCHLPRILARCRGTCPGMHLSVTANRDQGVCRRVLSSSLSITILQNRCP